ncbi:hypothetical protein J4457_06270 [Candidatus Woesearchaeota archaeon]|nr:hypothetical protein [Candidatus Woesearchaeota archaeon]
MERKYTLPVLQDKPICHDCLKWQQFGDKCFVYWQGKKFCSMKVCTQEEWGEEKKVVT